jgi:hypothetical protein
MTMCCRRSSRRDGRVRAGGLEWASHRAYRAYVLCAVAIYNICVVCKQYIQRQTERGQKKLKLGGGVGVRSRRFEKNKRGL